MRTQQLVLDMFDLDFEKLSPQGVGSSSASPAPSSLLSVLNMKMKKYLKKQHKTKGGKTYD